MRLRSLTIQNFRSHSRTEFESAERVNVLLGPNGAGKTNVLEAIGYLCLGKSFLGAADSHVVNRSAPFFSIEGGFEGLNHPDVRLRLAFVPGEGKRAFANGSPLDRLSDLIGRAPLVTLSPQDRDLTMGGPSERRRLLDSTLSQVYPVYLDDLIKYKRALRQKNTLLQQVRRGRALSPGTLDAWDEELALLGGRLLDRRRTFLGHFEALLRESHALLGSAGANPSLQYAPSVGLEDSNPYDALRASLARSRRRSSELGRTLVGPHLDEVDFRLDDFDLRPFGSQGQHRTFALAVRIAQALYLRDHLDEPPILLLDDVFGPLDPTRTNLVLELLASGELGQSFVSAARHEPFEGVVPFEALEHAVFHVEQGQVSRSASPLPPAPSQR